MLSPKNTKGFSLIEVIVALAVITTAAAGVFSYEFYVVKFSRQARTGMIAARTAQLLLEDWKANKGASDYDPNSLGLNFTNKLSNGQYKAVVDNLTMYFNLDTADIDTTAIPPLRQITVTAQWRDDCSEQLPEDGDFQFTLTTYCQ